jgi:AraC-like DNA-binding protein
MANGMLKAPRQPISDWFRECWNVTARQPQDCAIWQRYREHGDCRFVDLEIGPCHGRRGTDQISGAAGDGLYVTYYSRGELRFSTRGEEILLRSGDLLLWDPQSPSKFDCATRSIGHTVLFPRNMVEQRLGGLHRLRGVKPNPDDPRTPFLYAHFANLHGLAGRIKEDIFRNLLESTLDLTYVCLSDENRTHSNNSAGELLDRVRSHIRHHFGTDEMSPTAAARRLGVGVPEIHKALAAQDTTFAALLTKERVERAAQMLRLAGSRDLPITEIALSLGFYDSAHFSNTFRKYYNMSPRQYRNRS